MGPDDLGAFDQAEAQCDFDCLSPLGSNLNPDLKIESLFKSLSPGSIPANEP